MNTTVYFAQFCNFTQLFNLTSFCNFTLFYNITPSCNLHRSATLPSFSTLPCFATLLGLTTLPPFCNFTPFWQLSQMCGFGATKCAALARQNVRIWCDKMCVYGVTKYAGLVRWSALVWCNCIATISRFVTYCGTFPRLATFASFVTLHRYGAQWNGDELATKWTKNGLLDGNVCELILCNSIKQTITLLQRDTYTEEYSFEGLFIIKSWFQFGIHFLF